MISTKKLQRRAVLVCCLLFAPAQAVLAVDTKSLFEEIGQGARMQEKVDKAWEQLFHGDEDSESVYYPVGADMAYIKDIGSDDIRTEGMSYGMMIAAQLNKKEEFDRLWKWAKTYMQHTDGPYKGYFSWHNREDGSKIEQNPAPDGEEYFVQALFTASGRWGNGKGLYNYRAEADAILQAMLHQQDDDNGLNMFHNTEHQVIFTPIVQGSSGTNPGFGNDFTDPSYHLPAFYSKWAEWADKDQLRWKEIADTSRKFLRLAPHPKTGLYANQANFDGSPHSLNSTKSWAGELYSFDSFRTVMNLAVDSLWFGSDKAAQAAIATRQQAFFVEKGLDSYVNTYTLDGEARSRDRSTGMMAMNAVASALSTHPDRLKFVQRLWDAPIPTGRWRYYDGMLYMFGLLIASDNYKAYPPK